MKARFYYFSAFLCGLVVMAIELTATRLLAPYFGTSLYVWTNVIGLILVALAGGYYFGGWLADRKPHSTVYFSFIAGTGLWTILIPFISRPLFEFIYSNFSDLAWVVRGGSFLATAFLFILPLFALGMVVPFTVKLLVNNLKSLGRLCGKVSMVSTLGSLLGTFLPAFVLIPCFGTTRSFVFLGLLLVFLGALGLRRLFIWLIFLLLLPLFWWVPSVYAQSNLIASKESPYGFVFVTEDEKGVRRLHVDQGWGTQSLYDPQEVLTPAQYYYTYFGVLPALLRESSEPQSILILGHAGGTFTRIFNRYYPGSRVVGVELNPAMTELAEQYMGLNEAEVELVHADARVFLQASQERYDVILIDTYQGSSIPVHLITEEFFTLLGEHLNEHGVVALNASAKQSEFLQVLENTFVGAFPYAYSVAIPNSYNTLLVGHFADEFQWTDLPEDLQNHAAYIERHRQLILPKMNAEVFSDDNPMQVEILSEVMHMELYKGLSNSIL